MTQAQMTVYLPKDLLQQETGKSTFDQLNYLITNRLAKSVCCGWPQRCPQTEAQGTHYMLGSC
jgi:hypothetical protein